MSFPLGWLEGWRSDDSGARHPSCRAAGPGAEISKEGFAETPCRGVADFLEQRIMAGAPFLQAHHQPLMDRGRNLCLLYTSDAADDLLCVDLGGRRIIKKKKK